MADAFFITLFFFQAGNSLIHLCAMSCRLQCLNTVLSCSIRSHSPLLQLVNQSNNYGRTPLHIASFYGEESVVEILLNTQGIEIDKQTNVGEPLLRFNG